MAGAEDPTPAGLADYMAGLAVTVVHAQEHLDRIPGQPIVLSVLGVEFAWVASARREGGAVLNAGLPGLPLNTYIAALDRRAGQRACHVRLEVTQTIPGTVPPSKGEHHA